MIDSEADNPSRPMDAPAARVGEAKWVSIYTCRTREEAHLAVAKLRHLGIAARTDGEETAMVGLSVFSGSGAVTLLNPKVQVFESDAPAARAVLEEVDRRRVARLSKLPCPKCGAMQPGRVWAKPRLAAIVGLAVALTLLCSGVAIWPAAVLVFVAMCGIMWPLTPRWRCTACGHVWIAPDPDSEAEEADEDSEDHEGDEDDDEGDEDRDAEGPKADEEKLD
jgi:hypothetical protein